MSRPGPVRTTTAAREANGPSATSARLAVVVVSWNTRDLLARCLASLAGDVSSGLAHVCVVDNASSDGSADLVRREFGWAELISTGSNVGFGRAANRGVAATETDWVAVANADVEVTPGALATLLATGGARPEAGIVAPLLLLPDGSPQPSVHAFPTPANALLSASRLYRLRPELGARLCHPDHFDRRRARTVDWATGAFLVVRREAWEAIGGFDESQWMYAEDTDLAWRARRLGWTTYYEPAAVVRHVHAAAAARAFGDRRRARELAASYEWIARRQGGPAKWTVAGVSILEALARLVAARGLLAVSRRDRWVAAHDDARASLELHRTALAGGDRPVSAR